MTGKNIKKLNLLNIVHSSEDIQEKVRCIRNEPQIRKWMYTDHLISKDEHKNWIERLRNESRNFVYVVMNDYDEPIGVVSVNSIDLKNKKGDWAYYLTANTRTGIGAVLEFFVIDYVFNFLHLEKLNCEVIEYNDTVVRLHEKFGFKQEGFRESNIIKDDKRFGVYYFGLTKEKWMLTRECLKNKYYKLFSQYAVDFY